MAANKKAKKSMGKKDLKKTKGGLLPAVMPISDKQITFNPTLGQKIGDVSSTEFHF